MKRKFLFLSSFIIFQFFIFATLNAISTNEIKNEFQNILQTKNFLKVDEQSFCIKNENENSKDITGLNTKKQITPASVSKIFITEMILSKYDPDYRFYTGAKISKNTLYIYGGFDPFFETKDFLHLVNQITSKSKNPRINKIVFDKSFYINNSANSLKTKSNLQKIIKENKFEKNIFSNKLQIVSSGNLKSDKTGYVVASDILIDELGKMNFYSNNNAAEILFNFLGGENAFLKYVDKNYSAGQNTYFTNGSGLEFNTTTCEHTLKSLENLYKVSKEKKFDLKKVLSAPGGDVGAMRNLDMNIPKGKIVLAKNGYLFGNNTIVGIVEEENKKPIYFALFLTYKDANKYQSGIDTIKQFLNLMVK